MISLLLNDLRYLDHGYSSRLAISRYWLIVRELSLLLRAGLRLWIRVQAETVCLQDSGYMRLFVHLLCAANRACITLFFEGYSEVLSPSSTEISCFSIIGKREGWHLPLLFVFSSVPMVLSCREWNTGVCTALSQKDLFFWVLHGDPGFM